jgi:receptor-type tyrosine-protein phosphatase gamma
VNGNYIDGYGVGRAYLGTQGPLPATFLAFWSLIWDHRVSVIVMITNLLERGRKKCDQYWPSEGRESYGEVSVGVEREEVRGTYILRTLTLSHSGGGGRKGKGPRERTVFQYHYTNWPDHGTSTSKPYFPF